MKLVGKIFKAEQFKPIPKMIKLIVIILYFTYLYFI